MQAILKSLTAAGIQRCREDGRQVRHGGVLRGAFEQPCFNLLPVNALQCDAVEVAYLACLLEEQAAWPAATQKGGGSAAAADGQQQRLTLCSGKLSEDVLAIMAERVRQKLVHPVDPATAATAHLQVGTHSVPLPASCTTPAAPVPYAYAHHSCRLRWCVFTKSSRRSWRQSKPSTAAQPPAWHQL